MLRANTLRVRPTPVATLDPDTVEAMWRLYDAHYDNVTRDAFQRDLTEKTLVFLGTDAASGEVVGFSTALFYVHREGKRRVGIYFSGDTIIHPRYWGQHALHRAVVAMLVRWKLRHPLTPLYWYLICSGYRTYLTLVRNFPDHWPRHDRPTPAPAARLLDSVSRARYGDAWKADRGVVSFGGAQPVLKQAVAPFTRQVLALPEVAFFVKANPSCLLGDELAMLARVNAAAVVRMGAKWLRRSLQRKPRLEPVQVVPRPAQ